jgi:hypothetical protein
MRPLHFHYIDFQEPLLRPEEWGGRNALLLFATEAGRNAARRQIQASWEISTLCLMTMEEFKERLFLAPLPLLKEEKRSLAFFASLDAQARDFFRINTYFQSVGLANQFFALWEECVEAGLDLSAAREMLAAAGAELLPWQEKTLQQLIRIQAAYLDWITERGFSDRIFIRQDDFLDLVLLESFAEIVLVNPASLSEMEKRIVRGLQARDRQVTLICQMPAQVMDEEQLELRDFALTDLMQEGRQHITIRECCNEVALYTRFIQAASQREIAHAVDVSLQPCAFHHFLSPARFRLPVSIAMSETSIYHFFATLEELLDELVWDSLDGALLLPLPALLAAVQNSLFFHPLMAVDDPVERAARQGKTIGLLHRLQQEDYLYLDMEGRFFQTHHLERRELEPLLMPVLTLVKKMLEVTDLGAFSRLIDDPAGIPIRRILTGEESRFSTLLEVFYQSFADFNAIGELGIVDAWRSLLPGESRSAAPRGILRLFLEYIKSKRVRYEWDVERLNQIEFHDFSDARELFFDTLALLQVNEGQLPRPRSVPWLFTEQQREMLGLDTWDDLRRREKYAFFRLALSTPELHIFTIKNVGNNIEPSSFVEELCIAFPRMIQREIQPDIDYRDFSRQFFKENKNTTLPRPVREQEDFFRLPFAASKDFPAGEWRLSFYAYDQLKTNPFDYALHTLAGVPDWPDEWLAGLNHKLLGKVAQAVFDLCWRRFNEDALPFSSFERIFTQYGDQAIAALFSRSSDFYFKLPKNHELTYFHEFTLLILRTSGAYFFQQLHDYYHLDRTVPRVFPEAEFTSAAEMTPKLYLSSAESGLPVDVCLLGRADLRIEYGEPISSFLVDYKTGQKRKEEQLWFYELFYYLIDNPGMLDRVQSCFYRILDQRFEGINKKMKKASKAEFLAGFRSEMAQTLRQVSAIGYAPARRQGRRNDDLAEIIRMEIYHPR